MKIDIVALSVPDVSIAPIASRDTLLPTRELKNFHVQNVQCTLPEDIIWMFTSELYMKNKRIICVQ